MLDLLDAFRTTFQTVALTSDVQASAVEISRARGLHIYDANILAAAPEAGCSTPCSQDMQHGQVIGGLTIRNPFLDA